MEEKFLWKLERRFAVFPYDKARKALVREYHPPAG